MQNEKLVPQSYFDTVQRLMIAEGYALISRVAIDSQETGFHVPASYARSTSLFFHRKDWKGVVIKLEFSENDSYRDWPYGSWSISVNLNFLPMEDLVRMTYRPFEESGLDDDVCSPVPGWNTGLEFDGFRSYGHKWEEDPTPSTPMKPQQLAHVVTSAISPVLPYLTNKPFDELQVTSYP